MNDLWPAIVAIVLVVSAAAGVLVHFVGAENKILATRMDAIVERLRKMDGVLEMLAEQKVRLELIERRESLTGQRLDQLAERFNKWLDIMRDRS